VLAVMGLGATSGQQVVIRATGPDARPAVAALVEILAGATRVGS
jgi:phosphotransferase system HPr-like phosphotransfer protein